MIRSPRCSSRTTASGRWRSALSVGRTHAVMAASLLCSKAAMTSPRSRGASRRPCGCWTGHPNPQALRYWWSGIGASEMSEYHLRQATHADYDFLHWLHVAAMKEAIAQTWGWDDAF